MNQSVSFRPRRLRVVCWVSAVVVFAVFTAVSFGLHGPLGDGAPGSFQRGDQAAMIGIGVLAALGILLFTRPRVVADDRGIHVRNVLGGYDLEWGIVRAVRFSRGAPWASIELDDDDVVSVLAVQAADKQYAVEAVRALRAMLESRRAATSAPAEGS
ncbi:PH domain-containing protein [Planosporangium thailandense]|uniref:PH domain-containing protein n=1 Tax=Planosporangium thailandense TaxID=765197 RepID=A0ABX0Y5E7_9ACTN|nr:PH domain-containing protein [Planosporangium thailandense]NJC72775.1 PH domain-containing protein [Planosporangium thailandense]